MVTCYIFTYEKAAKPKQLCAEITFSLILASLRGTGPPHPEGEAIRPAETVRIHLLAKSI
jgi:hypothetical protein